MKPEDIIAVAIATLLVTGITLSFGLVLGNERGFAMGQVIIYDRIMGDKIECNLTGALMPLDENKLLK